MKRGFILFILMGGLLYGALFATTQWVESRIADSLGLTTLPKENISLSPLAGFSIRGKGLKWPGKAELVSGEIHVRYQLISLLNQNHLRVTFQGEGIRVSFLRDWAKQHGTGEVLLNDFFADLGLSREGIVEIYTVRAVGPKFKFLIKEDDNT